MGKFFHYLKLFAVVVGAGVLSGILVMWIALRDKGEIDVPSIKGNEIVTALEKVTRAGLNLKITKLSYDTTFPRNAVISQNPAAGKSLKRGRDVRVVISKGPRHIEMPDLRDMTLRQARNVLHARGVPAPSATKIHSVLEENTIIAHLPPAGDSVAENSRVEFLVSSGPIPKRSILADYRGKTLEEVADKILAAGLKLGRVRYVKRETENANAVLKQNPPPGMPVTKGEEISLVVLKKTTGGGDLKTFTVYNFVVPQGKESGAIKVISEDINGERVIYNRRHKAGEPLSFLVKVAGQTTVRVYMDDELVEVKRF